MPIATVPPRSAVSSPTLSAASSTARRLRARVLGERAARLGGDDAAAGADEEVGAERLLELADLLGDRRLGDAQRLGGGGEGAELDAPRRSTGSAAETKAQLWTCTKQPRLPWRLAPRAIMARMTRDVVDRRRRDRRARGGLAAAPPRRAAAGGRRPARRAHALGRRAATTGSTTARTSSRRRARSSTGWRASAASRPCPVTGSMMGLAVGSTMLDRGRVETYPFRLPLSLRDRVAFATAGLKVQRAVARYHRLERPLRLRGRPHASRSSSARSPPAPCDEIFACAAHRATAEPDELSAGCGIGLFALVWGGKGSLIARNLRRRRPAGCRPRSARARRPRAHRLPRRRHPARRRATSSCATAASEVRARHVIVAAQAPYAAPLVAPVRRAGRRRARAADLRRVPERRGRDQRDDRRCPTTTSTRWRRRAACSTCSPTRRTRCAAAARAAPAAA